jgi:hypothetical protein
MGAMDVIEKAARCFTRKFAIYIVYYISAASIAYRNKNAHNIIELYIQ